MIVNLNNFKIKYSHSVNFYLLTKENYTKFNDLNIDIILFDIQQNLRNNLFINIKKFHNYKKIRT